MLKKFKREYFVHIFFIGFFIVIVYTLFTFTVRDYDYYKGLAENQQTILDKTPLTRGKIIFSGNDDDDKVVANSASLVDLSINPSAVGNKDRLVTYLTDLVYGEICYKNSDCKKLLHKFLGVLNIEDFVIKEDYIKEKIKEKILQRVNKTSVTSVLITSSLTNEQAFYLEKLGYKGLYISSKNLYVNPEEITENQKDEICEKLISQLGGEKEMYLKQLKKRKLQYIPIIKKLSLNTSSKLERELEDEKIALSKRDLDDKESIYNFFIIEKKPHRNYPEGELAANIIGFVDSEGNGQYGIEGYFDNFLKGKADKILSRKDNLGRTIEPLSFNLDRNNKGADIVLTIDRNIQKHVEELIDEDLKEYRANSISAIVMNPKTGEILAMASNPRFNPNSVGNVYELEKVNYKKFPNPSVDLLGYKVFAIDNKEGKEYYYDGKTIFLREIKREEFRDPRLEKYVYVNGKGPGVYNNDIISDLYEPGSIFKPIVFAAGIDSGEIKRFGTYQDKGYVKIGQFTIKNVVRACMGYKTFQNAMSYSCNVGMIKISQIIGPLLFYNFLQKFGIGELSGITLNTESTGKLVPYDKWSRAQLFTTSFGQGIQTTMLQMALVYSTLANGGFYYKPQIVKSIKFGDGKVIINKSEPIRRVIKESTSKTMTDVLVESVNFGVAKGGKVEGYNIAGKTGTAQIAYKGYYESGPGSTMGFYAGYGPAEDPKFVIIVKVERPRISLFGGETVAKTFSKISKYLLNYYGIPPKTN